MGGDMYIAYSWLVVSLAGLAGFWLHLHYRGLRGKDPDDRVQRLEEMVTDLEAQLHDVTAQAQDRIEQLHERVDFAERLLTGRQEAGAPEPAGEHTPV